jgi:MFS family permease
MIGATLRRIPRGVWALGFVSLAMDLSSELIHALLPLYLAAALGASMLTIGVIEGIAEATALIVKVFSGVLSDFIGRRKPLLVLGYGLAAATKIVFPLATTLDWIVAARFVDRIGKGIRGAPRDALIADLAPADLRGASFGLRQTLDTVGGVGGPLLAIGAMLLFAGDFRAAFWVAVVPAVVALLLLVFAVDEPPRERTCPTGPPLRWRDAARLPAAYWQVVTIAVVLALARFSEAFLVLRAQDVGLVDGAAAWAMVVMSLAYAASAYPAGAWSDRGDGRRLLLAGIATLIAADLLLAVAAQPATMLVGVALWGLHLGLTQGLLAAQVAATSPPGLRGSAFGIFNLACGVMLLVASAFAGWLWDVHGPGRTFLAGALFATVATLVLVAFRPPSLRPET